MSFVLLLMWFALMAALGCLVPRIYLFVVFPLVMVALMVLGAG